MPLSLAMLFWGSVLAACAAALVLTLEVKASLCGMVEKYQESCFWRSVAFAVLAEGFKWAAAPMFVCSAMMFPVPLIVITAFTWAPKSWRRLKNK